MFFSEKKEEKMPPKYQNHQKRKVMDTFMKTPDTPMKAKKTRSCLRAALLYSKKLFVQRTEVPQLRTKARQNDLKNSCLAFIVDQRRTVKNSDIPQQLAKQIRKVNSYYMYKTALEKEEEVYSELFERLQSLNITIETYKDSIEQKWGGEKVKKVHECDLNFYEKMADVTAHKLIESKKLKQELKDIVIEGAYMIAEEFEFMTV